MNTGAKSARRNSNALFWETAAMFAALSARARESNASCPPPASRAAASTSHPPHHRAAPPVRAEPAAHAISREETDCFESASDMMPTG